MRTSAFRGTWQPNARPYLTLSPDAYVCLQGETTVIACGECRKEVNFNHYVTQISTEASVDSPPGSATVTLSIPDNDVNDFYIEGQFIIVSMMEVEIFGKGYFTVGGIPQYYKMFWGLVSSVTKNWANGVTTITLACKDILRWWELTNVVLNSAYLNPQGSSVGGYTLFQNQFASMNPYTVIVQLAKESMGDFSLTQGSFTSFTPENGPEGPVIGNYAREIMGYWQLKFANIWNSLVLYGTSGRSYTFTGEGATASGANITKTIVTQEEKILHDEGLASGESTAIRDSAFKVHIAQLAAFKTELARAGDVDFFQNETQSKLAVAMTARDQAGYEFYCDTTGDIIFKPPFYNLNVLPNKPVSWIQDFEIIDDSIVDSEAEVYTHITSSGNAFSGGSMDYGLNDDITTPRTGVFDFHLLRRYGWRRLDYQCEWASNPRQLFFHLLDYMDRVNSKRQNGNVTISMRPELRMGFPIWIPKYDSFFYIQGISHNFAVGGQATTVLTLIAKRSKFIAPSNIGKIEQVSKAVPQNQAKDKGTGKQAQTTTTSSNKPGDRPAQFTYKISFPQSAGETSGIAQNAKYGEPQIIRDPATGKMLGFPNVVMVFQKPFDGDVLAKINQSLDTTAAGQAALKNAAKTQGSAKAAAPTANQGYTYDYVVGTVIKSITGAAKADLVKRLRAHRYEAGMTNAGAYDYAHDVGANFKEITLVPVQNCTWVGGSDGHPAAFGDDADITTKMKALKEQLTAANNEVTKAKAEVNAAQKTLNSAKTSYQSKLKSLLKGQKNVDSFAPVPDGAKPALAIMDQAQSTLIAKSDVLKIKESEQASIKFQVSQVKITKKLNMLVRPVSDDFGFEVIGHYRYGRGAFIDRGKIQISDGHGGVANELNIQFAATGGLLTDTKSVNQGGPTSESFASAFEDMRPDDYVTGASFDHGVDGKGEVQNISVTNQRTYDGALLSSKARTGQVIFADADATRRGLTLAELKPTLELGISAGIEKCGCQLGKTNWLSVLPQTAIDQVLRPFSTLDPFGDNGGAGTAVNKNFNALQGGTTLGEKKFGNVGATRISTTITASGRTADPSSNADFNPNRRPVDFGSFFDILNDYLIQRFGGGGGLGTQTSDDGVDGQSASGDYLANANRERDAIGASIGAVNPNNDFEDNNILGDPQDPLFNRAANGDPAAIAALAERANFNFGMTANALKNFGKVVEDSADRAKMAIVNLPGQEGKALSSTGTGIHIGFETPAQQQLAAAQAQLEHAAFNLRQAEQFARDNPNSPIAKQALVDAQNAYADASKALASSSGRADRAEIISQAQAEVNNAQAVVSNIQSLLALDPNNTSLKLRLQQANTDLAVAQAALENAENGLLNNQPPPQYQPPSKPPTQGDILNPSKFGNANGAYRSGDPFPPYP